MKDNYDPEAWKHWPHAQEVDQEVVTAAVAEISGDWQRIDGAVFVCEVPKDLGRVTRLRMQGGKLRADTESGISMIVPLL